MGASIERKWELLREALTEHLEFNVFAIIVAMNIAILFGVRELAEAIFCMFLLLYFIALISAGIAIILLFFLSFVIDEQKKDDDDV